MPWSNLPFQKCRRPPTKSLSGLRPYGAACVTGAKAGVLCMATAASLAMCFMHLDPWREGFCQQAFMAGIGKLLGKGPIAPDSTASFVTCSHAVIWGEGGNLGSARGRPS